MILIRNICLLILTMTGSFFQANALQDKTSTPFFNDYIGDITNVVCPFKNDIDYEPNRVRCGFLTVPENREIENSRLIRIAFTHIIAEARVEDSESDKSEEEALIYRSDPIIYLTGGPGAGMEFYVGRFLEHDIVETRDLYILNQRGIGDSEELCPYYSSTSRELVIATNLEDQEKEDAARMKACFKAATERGVDLTAYNTVENARDVRALRQALGFDTWNVWGISYGSHLGQMLVNVDPEGIRALVLDAIVPNDLGDLMRLHKWIARNNQLIFTECKRQDASICDGLEEAFYAAGNTLLKNPIMVDALDEEVFPSDEVAVPALLVAFAPFAMMYEQDGHPAIPAVMRSLVDMVKERDPEVFQGLVNGADVFSGISEGMGSAIRCNDGYIAAEAAVAKQDLQEPFGFAKGAFTEAGSALMAQTCVESGLIPRNRDQYQLVETDIPTLIVNGNWDPITPPPLAERIAPGFSNGRLIIVPYAGHGPTRSMPECATQVLTDFFDSPTQRLDELDASCLEEGVAPPEFLNYVQTHMPLKFAAKALDDPKQLTAPAVLALMPILISFIGFTMISWGAVTRKFSSSSMGIPGVGPFNLRLTTAITALIMLIGVAFVGAGVAATFEISEISILAGFAPPARTGAILILLAGLLGILTMIMTVKQHKKETLRRRTLLGFLLIGLSTLLFSAVMLIWGITPW